MRQPFLEIPVAAGFAHQIQARMRERQSAKLEMPAQQAAPAQTNRERLGAEKIFVAEARIITDRDGIGTQGRPGPKAELVVLDFDGPSEGRGKVRGEPRFQAGVFDQQRNSSVGNPENYEQEDNRPQPRARARARRGQPRSVARDGGGYLWSGVRHVVSSAELQCDAGSTRGASAH